MVMGNSVVAIRVVSEVILSVARSILVIPVATGAIHSVAAVSVAVVGAAVIRDGAVRWLKSGVVG